MKHFVLDYDRAAGALVGIGSFADMAEALAEYAARERDAHGTEHEIVLLGAECEDDLRETHPRYFFGIAQMAERTLARHRERLSAAV